MMFWHKAGKKQPPRARKSANAHDLTGDGEFMVADPKSADKEMMPRKNHYRWLIAIGLWLSMIAFLPAFTQAPAGEEQGFSKGFLSASIRQLEDTMLWKESIVKVVQYNAPPGPWLENYRTRAAESLQLASTLAATAADTGALQLLRNQFNNLQQWNNDVVSAQAAGSTEAASAALKSDPLFSRISECGKFLTTMLTSGSLADNPACH
jgi:hypothetical protein